MGCMSEAPLTPERFRELFTQAKAEIRKAVVGHESIIDGVLTCLFAGGHALLEGVPGLGKTLLIRSLSEALHLQFSRIQFTPDLMPADVTGTTIVVESDGGRDFQFRKGPIFAQIVLADEINRATPKTQSALLEAMQERSVTVGGVTHRLDRPFFVMATQNPIEQEGTHPLPEAQLDRFMFNVVIDYPGLDEERRILSETTSGAAAIIAPVATGAELEATRALVRDLPAADNVVSYALRLVRATRPADDTAPPVIREWVKWGAGPRAGQSLLLGAKALALIDGRSVPALDDIRAVAAPVLRHRLLLNFQAEADGIDPDQVISRLLESVRP